jgi:hypothetical protein
MTPFFAMPILERIVRGAPVDGKISFQADRGAGGTTTTFRVSVVDRIAECGSALLLPDSNL